MDFFFWEPLVKLEFANLLKGLFFNSLNKILPHIGEFIICIYFHKDFSLSWVTQGVSHVIRGSKTIRYLTLISVLYSLQIHLTPTVRLWTRSFTCTRPFFEDLGVMFPFTPFEGDVLKTLNYHIIQMKEKILLWYSGGHLIIA